MKAVKLTLIQKEQVQNFLTAKEFMESFRAVLEKTKQESIKPAIKDED